MSPEYARCWHRFTSEFFHQRTFTGTCLAADQRDLAGDSARLVHKPSQFSELSLSFQEIHGGLEVSVKARPLAKVTSGVTHFSGIPQPNRIIVRTGIGG